ncbi:MAG: hypothetical protein LUQ08_05620 [Methanothrix sp.]|nr:hypothetical protein [Methanothrix sp.]
MNTAICHPGHENSSQSMIMACSPQELWLKKIAGTVAEEDRITVISLKIV